MKKYEVKKVSDEDWKELIESLKPYWREEFQAIAAQIPCDDEQLRMAMAMVLRDVCKIFENPMPLLGNITVREALKTKEGKELFKRVIIDDRYPNLYWLPPNKPVIKWKYL